MRSTLRRAEAVALCGVLTALAAIFSYIEALFPLSLGVPGIKLGLANIAVIFALYTLGARVAVTISLLRIILVSALFGNFTMALYSIAGALCSLAVMIALKRCGRFSLIGVSMAGGVCHTAGQLGVAMLAAGTVTLVAYLPALILAGMAAGTLIGWLTWRILPRLAIVLERKSGASAPVEEKGRGKA